MNFWLYWTSISLGAAMGVLFLGTLWWYFCGGKQKEREEKLREERKRKIMIKVKQIAEYDYEVVINGESFILDLDRLLTLLSTPEDK